MNHDRRYRIRGKRVVNQKSTSVIGLTVPGRWFRWKGLLSSKHHTNYQWHSASYRESCPGLLLRVSPNLSGATYWYEFVPSQSISHFTKRGSSHCSSFWQAAWKTLHGRRNLSGYHSWPTFRSTVFPPAQKVRERQFSLAGWILCHWFN